MRCLSLQKLTYGWQPIVTFLIPLTTSEFVSLFDMCFFILYI